MQALKDKDHLPRLQPRQTTPPNDNWAPHEWSAQLVVPVAGAGFEPATFGL